MADLEAMGPGVGCGEPVDIEFGGVAYSISVFVAGGGDSLVVEVEEADSLTRWRGEFGTKYVEDITAKTGNFKRFGVFVRMLQSAVRAASDAVFVDLLTYADLELLKSKKAGASGGSGAAPGRGLVPSTKRYLILTYASEFDRVHYPLPLLQEEQPDPGRLKAVIQQLRGQLAAVLAAQQQAVASSSARGSAGRPHPQLAGRQQPLHPLPHEGAPSSTDAALLASRLEVAAAELERERAAHRRELRKKARELAELHEELGRSRDVARELRLRCKGLEADLEAARRTNAAAAAAAAAQQRGRPGGGSSGSSRRPPPERWGPGAGGSSYLAGSSKYPGRPPLRQQQPSSSSRGSSPASSRAQSPGYSRPWAQNATPPRPSSAPPKQRFDPTEYVRQKRQREAAAAGARSRGSSPARSARGTSSGSSTPRGAGPRSSGFGSASRQGSLEQQQQRSSAGELVSIRAARPEPGSSRPSSQGRQRPGSSGSGSASRAALGAAYGVQPVAPGGRGSRSSSRQAGALSDYARAGREGAGAASPGRALQGVRDKLSAFIAKQQQPPQQQQQQQQPGPAAASPRSRPATAATAAAPAGAAVLPVALDGSVGGGGGVFADASSEIADIDQRLHALQAFLKQAKSAVAAS